MNVFTRCEVCSKEGAPEWVSATGMQQIYVSSGHWKLPAGWDVAFGVNLCGDCVARAKNAVTSLPPTKTRR